MSINVLVDTANDAIASIQGVASHIEGTFSQVGNHLGRGHGIIQELNGGLTALSQELSGTKMEGASTALQNIAGKLNGLAGALSAESVLLDNIGASTAQASSLLKPLVKQIKMITIIARSARIEAASLDGDRDNFLDFTREAFELAQSVQLSIDGCMRDQELLSAAIETALNRQKSFERHYRAQLISAGADLTSAYAGMRDQQKKSADLAEIASASAKRIAEAVGSSIISLQAGDSARQRLEHICRGLHIAAGPEASIAPVFVTDADGYQAKSLLCDLQVAQLKDTISGFDADIDQITRSLEILLVDAANIVAHGRSLSGSQDDNTSSFLDAMKQTLARASALIRNCDEAGKSVDDALSVVEDTLGKFRQAIIELSQTVVDITLIGMNAGLKASHLGAKGSAFVVIANELKATADHISTGAGLLKPILDSIERAANDLRDIRVEGDPSQLAELEPSILHAIGEIEVGNGRLTQWMTRLVNEGAQFEGLMTTAQTLLATLGEASATLPGIAAQFQSGDKTCWSMPPADVDGIGLVFDDLYAHYTMAGERDVHLRFLERCGLPHKPRVVESKTDQAGSEDVLFF